MPDGLVEGPGGLVEGPGGLVDGQGRHEGEGGRWAHHTLLPGGPRKRSSGRRKIKPEKFKFIKRFHECLMLITYWPFC